MPRLWFGFVYFPPSPQLSIFFCLPPVQKTGNKAEYFIFKFSNKMLFEPKNILKSDRHLDVDIIWKVNKEIIEEFLNKHILRETQKICSL